MTFGDWLFFGVIIVLVVNVFVARLPGWEKRRKLFWLIQALNITFGSLVIYFELPDLPTIVNFVIGLLFFFHVLQNNMRLQKWIHKRKDEEYQKQREEDKKRFNMDFDNK